jgi:pimeloyl-ACP methyl ester carboxylesterase
VAVVSALLLVACGGTPTAAGPTSTTTTPVPPLAPPPPITWTACPTGVGVQCGTVPVPLDYRHPGAGTLDVAVTRIPAPGGTAADGVLLVNPGGPAESGNQILPLLYPNLPARVRDAFDVVSFDPRGTGSSDLLRCGTDLSAVTSALPVPARAGDPLPGTPVFAGIPPACRAAAPALTPHVDTVDTARDMDRIRQALGVSTVSYYGLSYGTVLGTAYATLFPHRVRAMVLDGASDFYAPLSVQASEEAPPAEHALVALLDACTRGPSCPLGTDPVASFTRLAASLAAHPLPAPGDGDDTPVTVGDLDTAAMLVISEPGFGPLFYSAMANAAGGDGSGLRSVALLLAVDIDRTPLVDPLWAITCNDTTGHPGPVAAGAQARVLAARYPLLGGYMVNLNLGGCVAWPAGSQPVAALHPVDAPPVLVIGNTGDPNTPYVGARHLAAAFPRASLLTWDVMAHTWLLNGAPGTCMQDHVSAYLTAGTLPPAGTVCH